MIFKNIVRVLIHRVQVFKAKKNDTHASIATSPSTATLSFSHTHTTHPHFQKQNQRWKKMVNLSVTLKSKINKKLSKKRRNYQIEMFRRSICEEECAARPALRSLPSWRYQRAPAGRRFGFFSLLGVSAPRRF